MVTPRMCRDFEFAHGKEDGRGSGVLLEPYIAEPYIADGGDYNTDAWSALLAIRLLRCHIYLSPSPRDQFGGKSGLTEGRLPLGSGRFDLPPRWKEVGLKEAGPDDRKWSIQSVLGGSEELERVRPNSLICCK